MLGLEHDGAPRLAARRADDLLPCRPFASTSPPQPLGSCTTAKAELTATTRVRRGCLLARHRLAARRHEGAQSRHFRRAIGVATESEGIVRLRAAPQLRLGELDRQRRTDPWPGGASAFPESGRPELPPPRSVLALPVDASLPLIGETRHPPAAGQSARPAARRGRSGSWQRHSEAGAAARAEAAVARPGRARLDVGKSESWRTPLPSCAHGMATCASVNGCLPESCKHRTLEFGDKRVARRRRREACIRACTRIRRMGIRRSAGVAPRESDCADVMASP